jgi:hypothetical protein
VLTICRRVFPVVADDGDERERERIKKEKNECICPSIRNEEMGIEKKRDEREGSRHSV